MYGLLHSLVVVFSCTYANDSSMFEDVPSEVERCNLTVSSSKYGEEIKLGKG